MPKFERTVPRTADRFAVLFFDPADGTRFIVEVQTGPADTDQLARALDLWETERTRLPVAHRVVVAAERIPVDVAHAAALAQASAPVELLELHAERTGKIVTVHGEPFALPGPDDPIAPGPRPGDTPRFIRRTYDARVNTGTPEHSPLDDSFALAGAWLAARIEEDPARLGLGDGTPSFERTVTHERHDQFAAILFHSADGVRHIIEVQLGTADTAQINRAVAHLEEEQNRLPLIPHRAAIAAERIPAAVLAAAEHAAHPVDVIVLKVEPSGELATVHGELIHSHRPEPNAPGGAAEPAH